MNSAKTWSNWEESVIFAKNSLFHFCNVSNSHLYPNMVENSDFEFLKNLQHFKGFDNWKTESDGKIENDLASIFFFGTYYSFGLQYYL